MGMDGKLSAHNLQGHRDLQFIPLVIRYASGVPAVLQNPTGEAIALTDTGTGEVTITLSDASISPLICLATVRATAPSTLGNNVNIKGAPTTTVVVLLVNSDADGTTETDPVDLDVLLVKHVNS